MSDISLKVEGLVCNRGHSQILQGVTLAVSHGVTGLIGRNGMGKTTLAECLMGMLPSSSGTVTFNGKVLSNKTSDHIAKSGIALVPQGRRLFKSLSVSEHFTMARSGKQYWTPNRVFDAFPRLKERKRNRPAELSGGEQQMVAIGRALLQNPSIMIMDEPSEGLAPVIVDELSDVVKKLASDGMPILLIEQNLSLVERTVTELVHIMANGKIAESVDTEQLSNDTRIQDRVLGVTTNVVS